MSYYSKIITAKTLDKCRKRDNQKENKKRLKYDVNHFECSTVSYLPIFIVGIIFFTILLIVCIVTNLNDIKEVLGVIWEFVFFIAFFTFVAWGCEHKKLSVDGADVVYANALGFKRHFRFPEITKCLTTEQYIKLYVGNRKVTTLDKDMHCLEFFIARCNKEGIKWKPQNKRNISKTTLVLNASRTLSRIYIWLFIFISIVIVPVSLIRHVELIEILEIEAILLFFVGIGIIAIMICNLINLKEVRLIEKNLNINFNDEMRQRRAIGREYQYEDWFIEAIPGTIEILNRKFIKEWCGVKSEETSNYNKVYHIEFIDINDKRHKIGGHYIQYAQAMDQWYKSQS